MENCSSTLKFYYVDLFARFSNGSSTWLCLLFFVFCLSGCFTSFASLARIFNDFKLLYRVICFNCKFAEELSFRLGNLFNLEGDFILGTNEEIYVLNRSCKQCGCFYYLDFKEIFTHVEIREIYHGIKILVSENS